MWELSVNKVHHADMVEDLLEALVAQLANADLQVEQHILHSSLFLFSCHPSVSKSPWLTAPETSTTSQLLRNWTAQFTCSFMACVLCLLLIHHATASAANRCVFKTHKVDVA